MAKRNNYQISYIGGKLVAKDLTEKQAWDKAFELEDKGYKVIIEKKTKKGLEVTYDTNSDYESETSEMCFITTLGVEKAIKDIVEPKQKKKGYIDTQSKEKRTPITTILIWPEVDEHNEHPMSKVNIVGVRVKDDVIEIATDDLEPKPDKEFFEYDLNWYPVNCELFPYYETLFAIANNIEEYVGTPIIK